MMSLSPSNATFNDALAYVLNYPSTVVNVTSVTNVTNVTTAAAPAAPTLLPKLRSSEFHGSFDRSEFFATSASTGTEEVSGYGAFGIKIRDIDGFPGDEMTFQFSMPREFFAAKMKCTLISTVGSISSYTSVTPLRDNPPGQRERYTGTLAGMPFGADTAQLQCEYQSPLVSTEDQPEEKLDDHGRETVQVRVEARGKVIKDNLSVLVEKRNLANSLSIRFSRASIQSDILIDIGNTLFEEPISFVALEGLTNNVEFVAGFHANNECAVLLTQPSGNTYSFDTKPQYVGGAVRFDLNQDFQLTPGGYLKLICGFGIVDIKKRDALSITPIALMVGSNIPKSTVFARESMSLAGVKTNGSAAVGLTAAVIGSTLLATILAMF